MTVRKPPPGKGYDLQREYTEGIEPYWFKWEDQWWELPHRKMLDYEKLLRVAQLQDTFREIDTADVEEVIAKLNGTFTMLMGEEQGADFAKVNRPLEFLMDTLSRWREHSGEQEEETGESSASTGSSKSTERPSKRTSTGSTKSGSRRPSTPRARKTATPPVSSSSGSAG
jgi:hypothetical protein